MNLSKYDDMDKDILERKKRTFEFMREADDLIEIQVQELTEKIDYINNLLSEE